MHILTYETTGSKGSAAVISSDGTIALSASSSKMDHLKDISTLAAEALEKKKLSIHDISYVAAAIGPGSFTGIRIGVTTARTVAQMLNIPCIPVQTLKAMARMGQFCLDSCSDELKTGGSQLSPKWILTIINARRRQAYGALWRIDGSRLEEVMPQKQYIIDEMLPQVLDHMKENESVLVTGDGFDAYGDTVSEVLGDNRFIVAPEEYRYQRADAVASVALEMAQNGEFTDYSHMLPDYMRKSEAEMRLENGTLSKRITSPDNIDVRRALPADLDKIMKLEKIAFPDPWSRQAMAKDIDSPDAVVLTATWGTVFAGYLDMWRVAGEGQLNNIAVMPEYRGRGIGQRLMKEALAILKGYGDSEMNLEVRKSNRAARSMYTKLGFSELGIRPGYYENNGEDGVIMKKELKSDD